ncbi:Uma2 family endonuclease [Fibrella sp. HMF5335]|uniref:Uma2 family endonuclease n=1 Tax=Fibrella rubiginis TaxID=2817060 RepID=A0A939GH41_9BACT|nr:Uma2 family endonuclease [Fibrella rubiginis]MBO0939042.1 Uma2 family endonuclease [Fibrella rubiginis]
MTTVITDLSQLDPSGTYSYADYIKWQFEQRVELLRGKLFEMSPAPSVRHQRIVGMIHGNLFTYFTGEPYQLFIAPFDVRLYNRKKSIKASKDIYTVVQPDLCVICDSTKLDEQGCNGAPDIVVEVLSPGNTKREMNQKFDLYQEAGVQEYWLVEPADEVVFVYVLNEHGQYIGLRPMTETLTSSLFPDLIIDLEKLFG